MDINPADYQGLRPVQLGRDGWALRLLDQTRLPNEELWLELDTLEDIARAIETLTVRGAPAIGCAAALGLYVLSRQFDEGQARFRAEFEAAAKRLAATRPTAVNLFVAIDQQHIAPLIGPRNGQIDGKCRLTDAALTGCDGDDASAAVGGGRSAGETRVYWRRRGRGHL